MSFNIPPLAAAGAFEVMEIFRDLAHALDKTIAVVTHDTRLEHYMDALYSITDGVMRREDVGPIAEDWALPSRQRRTPRSRALRPSRSNRR
ncbi:MAG: hypothetical protein ABF532_05545 [Bifidobacterium sp.]|uniref:hypothetical protein n=1 Tax=Bifidobacterium sp. TaxID=41200 RepID=UPI0039EB17DA